MHIREQSLPQGTHPIQLCDSSTTSSVTPTIPEGPTGDVSWWRGLGIAICALRCAPDAEASPQPKTPIVTPPKPLVVVSPVAGASCNTERVYYPIQLAGTAPDGIDGSTTLLDEDGNGPTRLISRCPVDRGPSTGFESQTDDPAVDDETSL